MDAHTLLVVTVVEEVNVVSCPSPPATEVHLDERNLFAQLGERSDDATTQWIIDTGATNHKIGSQSAFAELDGGVHGSMRFGDGSIVGIEGRGTVLFKSKTGGHQKLTVVYHIPRLTGNIISLGQLEEEKYKIVLEAGALRIWDPQRRLVAVVRRGENHLYVLNTDVDKQVCLAARAREAPWRWHARYGHLGFQGLQILSKGEMVCGMPWINHVDQVCDGCLVGMQRRLPFPAASKFRAARHLELVHADLCGPIMPPTPGGKKLFLLVVDDMSRYTWLVLLATKDEAGMTISRLQVRAGAEVGRKLGTPRTDQGGEFTAHTFGEYRTGQGIQRHYTAPYTPQQNDMVDTGTKPCWGWPGACSRPLGGSGENR